MSQLRRAIVVAFLFVLLAFPARLAAQPAGKGTRYAFLVGCAKYLPSEFRELPFTGNDVLGFRDALLATGFAADHISLLHDGAADFRFVPSRGHILDELDLLLEGMRPQDTLVVALSGHGVQFKGDPVSYFAPLDGKVSDKGTLIALSGKGGLYERLKACKAKRKLLIVNACRHDPAVSLDFAKNKAELVDEDREGEVPEGIAAIYSCAAGQKSYYDPRRKIALFYAHLIAAWRGEYAQGGKVTLEHVLDEVPVRTKIDASKTLGVKQVPQIQREYEGEWLIAAAPVPRLSEDLAAGRQLLRQGEPARALPLLEKAVAAMPEDAAARVARGLAYLRTSRYAEALADFKEAARRDPKNAEAALQLGWMHHYGFGVMPPNHAEAVRWYRTGAELGNTEAMVQTGDMSFLGLGGMSVDYREAVQWYRKAAERGEPLGMCNLGLVYSTGRGVAKDEEQGRDWYRRAFEALRQTPPESCTAMGYFASMYLVGLGTAKDYGEALRWYRTAAAMGDAHAMRGLAGMHYEGFGVAKDVDEAARWYRKAAGLGESGAMASLGMLYASGQGVAKDHSEALRLLHQAVELGDNNGMLCLGIVYAAGLGVAKDQGEALRWFHKAAERGQPRASNFIGYMYENGLGVAKSDAEAFRWYARAADLGEAVAMNNLGVMYETGRGVAADLGEAIRWYRRAAEKGHADARDNLRRLGAN